MKTTFRNAAIVVAVLALLASGAAITMSYLTSRESVTNTFTVGDLEIGLKEPDWDPNEGDGSNVYPGYSVYKNPTVKNITSSRNGEEPCYVRMRVRFLDGGALITDTQRLDLIKTMIRYDSTYTGNYESKGSARTLAQGRIPGYSLAELQSLPMINPVFTVDQARSTASEIICRYMGASGDGILRIGEQATLFTTLGVPTEWTNREMALLGDFQIEVKAEAIQSSGFASQNAAFDALDQEIAAAKIQASPTEALQITAEEG